MEELPLVPKTKSAWIACLLLIVALFWYYYTFLHPTLLESYKQQNLVIPYTFKETDSLTKDLEVHLIIPRFLGSDTVQYATVSIYNLKQQTVHLKLRLIWEKKGQDVADINRDLSVVALTDVIQPGEVSIQVQPNSFEFVRLPLIFIGESVNLKEELFVLAKVSTPQGNIGEEKLSAETDSIPVVNRIYSSWNFILKSLLLPPLANVLLAGLTIISCWLFEDGDHKNEPINKDQIITIFSKSALLSFVLITLFYALEVDSIPILVFSLLIIWAYIFINHRRG